MERVTSLCIFTFAPPTWHGYADDPETEVSNVTFVRTKQRSDAERMLYCCGLKTIQWGEKAKMYLGKAKKAIDQLDQKEFDEKRARNAERESGCVDAASQSLDFKLEELPDGACFRPKTVNISKEDQTTAIRHAEVAKSVPFYF